MTIKIKVVDNDNNPVENAEVVVAWRTGTRSTALTSNSGVADMEYSGNIIEYICVWGEKVLGGLLVADDELITVATRNCIRCSACGNQLDFLGDPKRASPHASILGSEETLNAMYQWRGIVCIECKRVYCVDCVGYDAHKPKPCPICGKEPKPALREYLLQAGILYR
jgi:hypothetical protein